MLGKLFLYQILVGENMNAFTLYSQFYKTKQNYVNYLRKEDGLRERNP